MKKIILLAFALVLLSTAVIVGFVRPAVAEVTIYIRADGSIEGTTDISTVDNVTYTFTDNIVNQSIVVERDNIVVDGEGYTLQGTGASSSKGIDLTGRSNVTIKNTKIKAFDFIIYLYDSSNNSIVGNHITNNSNVIWLSASSNNNISGNRITNNWGGILLAGSFNNTITENNITNNYGNGIQLEDSSNYNIISGNNITNNGESGISLSSWPDSKASHNRISENNIAYNNGSGIILHEHSNYNIIFGNNIYNNTYGISLAYSSNNRISANYIANNHGNGIVVFLSSNYNSITENNITNNSWDGVYLNDCTNNDISINNIANNGNGIDLGWSSNNSISGNVVSNNFYGIWLSQSSNYNNITANNITANNWGFVVRDSSDNSIYHNNFVDNTNQVESSNSVNVWDDGADKGNYWSDYEERYPNATEIDGIWDTPYVIDENNQDNYPLVPEFPTWTSMLLILVMLTLAIGTYKRRLLKTQNH